MKASFVINHSARAELKKLKALRDNPLGHLPRQTRLTLRITTPKQASANTAHTDLTEHFRTEYRRDDYHNQNLEFADFGYDGDEFADVDNELDGLTVFEPLNEVELFQFCTGYDVI